MVAHTGFLVTARLLAEGTPPPELARRPAPAALDEHGAVDSTDIRSIPQEDWTPEAVGERLVAERKTRKVIRDLERRAAHDEAMRSADSGD